MSSCSKVCKTSCRYISNNIIIISIYKHRVSLGYCTHTHTHTLAEGGRNVLKMVKECLVSCISDRLDSLYLLKDDTTDCGLQLHLLQTHTTVNMVTLTRREGEGGGRERERERVFVGRDGGRERESECVRGGEMVMVRIYRARQMLGHHS